MIRLLSKSTTKFNKSKCLTSTIVSNKSNLKFTTTTLNTTTTTTTTTATTLKGKPKATYDSNEDFSRKIKEITNKVESNLIKCGKNDMNKMKYFEFEINRLNKMIENKETIDQLEVIILLRKANSNKIYSVINKLYLFLDIDSRHSIPPLNEVVSNLIKDKKIIEAASMIDKFVAKIPSIVNQDGFELYLKPISQILNPQQFTLFISNIYKHRGESDFLFTIDRFIHNKTDIRFVLFIYNVFSSLVKDGSNKMFKRVFRYAVSQNDFNTAMNVFQDMKQSRVLPSAEIFQRYYEFSVKSNNIEALDELLKLNFKLYDAITLENKTNELTISLVYNQLKTIKIRSLLNQQEKEQQQQQHNLSVEEENQENNEKQYLKQMDQLLIKNNQFKLDNVPSEKVAGQFEMIFSKLKQQLFKLDQNTLKSVLSNIILAYLKLNQYELALQWFRDTTYLFKISPNLSSYEWFILYHFNRSQQGTTDYKLHQSMHAYWTSLKSINYQRIFQSHLLFVYDSYQINKDLYLMEYLDGNTTIRGFPMIHSTFLPPKFNDVAFETNSQIDFDYALHEYLEKGLIPETYVMTLLGSAQLEKGNFKLFSNVPSYLAQFFIHLDFRVSLRNMNEVLATFKPKYFSFYPQLEPLFAKMLESTLLNNQIEYAQEIFKDIIEKRVQLSEQTMEQPWFINFLEQLPIGDKFIKQLPQLFNDYFKHFTPSDAMRHLRAYEIRVLLELGNHKEALETIQSPKLSSMFRDKNNIRQFIQIFNLPQYHPINENTTLEDIKTNYYQAIYKQFFKSFDLEFDTLKIFINDIVALIYKLNQSSSNKLIFDFINDVIQQHQSSRSLIYKFNPDVLVCYLSLAKEFDTNNFMQDPQSYIIGLRNKLINENDGFKMIITSNKNENWLKNLNSNQIMELFTSYDFDFNKSNQILNLLNHQQKQVNENEKVEKEIEKVENEIEIEKEKFKKRLMITNDTWSIYKQYVNHNHIPVEIPLIQHSSLIKNKSNYKKNK